MKIKELKNTIKRKELSADNELYKAFKGIEIKNLSEFDKEELLKIFINTQNPLVYNQIAFIFSDLNYEKSISYIVRKVRQKKLYHDTDSLLYVLSEINSARITRYFLFFIELICIGDFGERHGAFIVVDKYKNIISKTKVDLALATLHKRQMELEKTAIDKGKDSMLHFVKRAIFELNKKATTKR